MQQYPKEHYPNKKMGYEAIVAVTQILIHKWRHGINTPSRQYIDI